MNKAGKLVIVVVLVAAVISVIVIKGKSTSATSEVTEGQKALPRLVDLGAKKCIPCKLMAPMLEELKKEYAGTLQVDFIDVWKKPEEAKKYGIKIIPTQIFFDASGKELFRHEGFMSKEDILAKWKELGIDIKKGQKDEKTD